jgi:hypothetical protein
MGDAPVRLSECAQVEHETANPLVRHWRATKSGLAVRYNVGIRTIENWLYAGIICARSEQGQALFDVAECDERLLSYKK